MSLVPSDLAARLHRTAGAERWNVPVDAFAEALERSVRRADPASRAEPDRLLSALHLEDLALALGCERGDEGAWDHFVREFRPALYRAGLAIDAADGRELADSLYGELFGLREKDGERQSLFRYFHGRSSLGTWLRAILAQRHVDGVRARRRLEPLPDEDTPSAPQSSEPGADERVQRHRLAAGMQTALAAAIGRLEPRDRLRLGWYYAQEMTLAEIGRVLGEHEATVSRHLNRARKALRADIEAQLSSQGLGSREMDECFAAAAEDTGAMDLRRMLDASDSRKNPALDRSKSEGVS